MQKWLPLVLLSAIISACSSEYRPTPIRSSGYTAISISPDKYKLFKEGESEQYMMITQGCRGAGDGELDVELVAYNMKPEDLDSNHFPGTVTFESGKVCKLIDFIK